MSDENPREPQQELEPNSALQTPQPDQPHPSVGDQTADGSDEPEPVEDQSADGSDEPEPVEGGVDNSDGATE